jgi:hypothetical protein
MSFLADYFTDSCYQALAYWIMSAMTNDPFTLARYAGFYKAIQSAVSRGYSILTVPLTLLLTRARQEASAWMPWQRHS